MTSPNYLRRRWVRVTASTLTSAAVFVTTALLMAHSADAGQPAADGGVLPARYTQQKPAWGPCEGETGAQQCATIEAPLDYRRPAEATITLAVSRLTTSTPARRRGILLFNPGGPGDPGLDWPHVMSSKLPKDVTEQYDLIGFDPRGIGTSSPVRCPVIGADGGTPETFDQDVAAARDFATTCTQANPTVLHITTRNTARDMDLIRAILGEEKLSYFGFSYGTYLGAVYTQLFPHRTDRIVLDSAIDPALVWRRKEQLHAVDAEAAFGRWTRWAAERDTTYHLGATPKAVRTTFWNLVAKASSTPIKLDGESVTGRDIRAKAAFEFVFVQRSSEWIAALHEAAGQSQAASDSAAVDTTRGEPGQAPELEDVGPFAIVCNDATWPRDPETYRRDALRNMKRYPLSGYETSTISPCAFWTNPQAEPATTVRNNVKALIVHNEWDANTPSPMAYGLHRAMRASRLVLVDEAEGHIVYGDGNTCAESAINTYLSTGALPTRNLTCKAQQTPPGR